MDKALLFNDKIISVFNSLDGRDKVFKFIQYFSSFLHYCIENKYLTRLLNLIIKKRIKIRSRIRRTRSINITNTNTNTTNNTTSNTTTINKIINIIEKPIILERLKSLEDSFSDARIVFRLFGFFREFNNLAEFFKNIINDYKKQNNSSSTTSTSTTTITSIIYNSIKSCFSSILELIDHSFNFISEINDIIFWGTRIKIFELKDSKMDLVCKVSNFVWVYSLGVFTIQILYNLISTSLKIIKLNEKLLKNNQEEEDQEMIKNELIILNNNKINEIKSLISAISEFGLCICSIYEIENNAIIGACGSISAFISLQEIWNEICIEQQERLKEEEEQDNHGDGDGSDSGVQQHEQGNGNHVQQQQQQQVEQIQFALVCPPIIRSK